MQWELMEPRNSCKYWSLYLESKIETCEGIRRSENRNRKHRFKTERTANYGNYPKCVIPANFVGNSKIKQLIILKSTGTMKVTATVSKAGAGSDAHFPHLIHVLSFPSKEGTPLPPLSLWSLFHWPLGSQNICHLFFPLAVFPEHTVPHLNGWF